MNHSLYLCRCWTGSQAWSRCQSYKCALCIFWVWLITLKTLSVHNLCCA